MSNIFERIPHSKGQEHSFKHARSFVNDLDGQLTSEMEQMMKFKKKQSRAGLHPLISTESSNLL